MSLIGFVTIVTVCMISFKNASSLPLYRPVFLYPVQTLTPYQVPVTMPLRHTPKNNYVTDPEPEIRTQLKHNGHQNPQNIDRNEVNYINEDTISIEPDDVFSKDNINNVNAKLSIGDFIMGISWLPFEVNVPDTISWIYNGIAGVIGGIGQRFPFVNHSADEPRPYSNNEMNSKLIIIPIGFVNVPPSPKITDTENIWNKEIKE